MDHQHRVTREPQAASGARSRNETQRQTPQPRIMPIEQGISLEHLSPATVIALQRSAGNAAVNRLLQRRSAYPSSLPSPEAFAAQLRLDRPATPGGAASSRVSIQRLWTMQQFQEAMGEEPKQGDESATYKAMLDQLRAYHNIVKRYRAQLDTRGDSLTLYREALAALPGPVQTLRGLCDSYLNDPMRRITSAVKHPTSVLAPLVGKSATPPMSTKQQAVTELKGQLDAAIRPAVLQAVREAHWRTLPRVLTDAQLNPGSVQQGVASGAVNTVGKATYALPGGGALTGYTKEDKAGTSDSAKEAGIPEADPKQAFRSVAAFEVSELLELGIVPRTALMIHRDARSGELQFGQVMESAPGSAGQVTAPKLGSPASPQQAQSVRRAMAVLANPDATPQQIAMAKDEIYGVGGQRTYVEVDGTVYQAATAVANFDWMNPTLQQKLSTLQVFDLITGHVDRHAGNYIVDFEPANKNNVRGVKGIDNDDTFGANFANVRNLTMAGQKERKPDLDLTGVNPNKKVTTKTPGLPAVVDYDTAVKVLTTEWERILQILQRYRMTDAEIRSTQQRFLVVKLHIRGLIANGGAAYLNAAPSPDEAAALARLAGIDVANLRLTQWGPQTAAMQNENNSYAAKQAQVVASARVDDPGRQQGRLAEPEYRN